MDHYRINHFSVDPRTTRRRIRFALISTLAVSILLALASTTLS